MTNDFLFHWEVAESEMHATAREKGFWDDRDKLVEIADAHSPELGKFARLAVGAMNIALMHSELSEMLEGLRHGNPPDDKIPDFTAVDAEAADTVIRIMDSAAANGWRVGEAVVAKAKMNKGRSHKHGGKEF